MDAETNYESDLSESWSAIDISLNEEPFITSYVSSTCEKNESAASKNVKLNEAETQDFVNKCEGLVKMDLNSDSLSTKEDVGSCKDMESVQSFQNLNDDVDDDEKNDSGDTESIEILDMNGNYQDSETDLNDLSIIDNFDIITYQSDDEESSDGKSHKKNRCISSTVIKRKRRRISRSSEGIVRCTYSENACVNDTKVMNEKFNKTKSNIVYKHYRNNVVNTVLSLSVGVIFAGVACLAIGHFLGVQDAAETAVELVEALKKLQVENAALQSSIVHLKKVTNSKLELPLNQSHTQVSCEEIPKIKPPNTQTDLNNAALSEICSSLNVIEWLLKLQNTVKKGTKTDELETHGHYRVNLLRERKKMGGKLSNNPDSFLILKKLLILNEIMNRFSSHDNIEVMHERLNKLKHTLNHNLNKIFRDSLRRKQSEICMPETEHETKIMHWASEKSDESEVLYKFPQPEKYYELEAQVKERSSNNSLKNYDNVKKTKNKSRISESEKIKEYKRGKKFWKKEKEMKEKKKDRKKKHNLGKKFKKKESEYTKLDNSMRPFNASNPSYKKKKEKGVIFKRKVKKMKNSKPKRECDVKKKYFPFCSQFQCFNVTGYWFFKRTDGREKFRRHQTLSEWQFDRAKGRNEFRNERLDENWLFKRALGRESNRNYD